MGIGLNSLHLIARPLAELGELKSKKILTLGVQDCHFTYDQLIRFLGRHGIPHVELQNSEIELTNGFRWLPEAMRTECKDFIHQTTLFRVLGFERENIHAMDHSAYEGANIVHDLNVPVGQTLEKGFDFIFDGGTVEHVFSVKDSLFNIGRMCAVGGVVVNINPADYINHGFINLNAELYRDFYLVNGFEKIDLKYVSFPTHKRLVNEHYMEFDPPGFQSLQPYYASLVFSAFKRITDQTLRVPNQGLYEEIWHSRTGGAKTDTLGFRGLYASRLKPLLGQFIDRFFPVCVILRGYRTMRKGRRVVL